MVPLSWDRTAIETSVPGPVMRPTELMIQR
jgi:hypothetical protein